MGAKTWVVGCCAIFKVIICVVFFDIAPRLGCRFIVMTVLIFTYLVLRFRTCRGQEVLLAVYSLIVGYGLEDKRINRIMSISVLVVSRY